MFQDTVLAMAFKSSKKKSISKYAAPPETFIQHQLTSTRTLYDNIVYIEVGASIQRFGIHKSLLCHRSAFFEAAFNGSFKEGEEGVVVLEDEDPETFQRFNEWLYTGILLDEQEKKDISYGILVDLHIFAEKRIMPGLQNDTIDALIRLGDAADSSMDSPDVNRIWHYTDESSKIRRFVIDQFVYTTDLVSCFNWVKNGEKAYDADFVRQVAIGLSATRWNSEGKRRPDSETYFKFKPWEHRCCRYHTHEEGESLCEGSL